MNTLDKTSIAVGDAKQNALDFAKSKLFDLIAAAIVCAMIALSLGVIELREITLLSIANILLDAAPFYLCAVLLSLNYYTKGSFQGKTTEAYTAAVSVYSTIVSKLTGHQIHSLNDFCAEYNNEAKKHIQESILRAAAVTFEQYDSGEKPLKVMSKKELKNAYGDIVAKAVIKANKVRIKGICANSILGNDNIHDSTNLGQTEQEMYRKRSITYASFQVFAILIMSAMAVKNIFEWGWVGICFVIFKLLYIFARSYMRYFEGFKDITTIVANHYNRKSDVMKEFYDWYSKKYADQEVKTK